MTVLDDILSKLDKVKRTGEGKYLACCPAHDDRSPSLPIKQTDDGKILIHCFAGCSVEEIVSALGLELSDLMPENPQYKKGKKPPRFNKYELFDKMAYGAGILSVAIAQLLKGKGLNDGDLTRVVQAEETINDILKEVRT